MGILSKIIEFLLKIEEKHIMREVSKDKDLKRTEVPDAVHDAIFDEIRRKEEKWEIERRALEQISSENKELIRLGKIYQKDLHRRKYIVLAAILVLAMSMSVTSFGGVDRMFHKISSMICGRSRETVDTEGVKTLTESTEEEVYAEIEKMYGVKPVRISYLPGNSELLEVNIIDNLPEINVIYGTEERLHVIFDIVIDYRSGSWSKDIEDEVLDQYIEIYNDVEIQVKKIGIRDMEERWLLQFMYEDIYYSVYLLNIEESEVEKVIDSICFP